MVQQGYYTLQEAAQVLGMAPDKLKQMAQKNQIRSFQDRGTWRFRVQDIQELARERGASSDLDIILGDEPAAGPSSSSVSKGSGPRSSVIRTDTPKSGVSKGPASGVSKGPASGVSKGPASGVGKGPASGVGKSSGPPKSGLKKEPAASAPPSGILKSGTGESPKSSAPEVFDFLDLPGDAGGMGFDLLGESPSPGRKSKLSSPESQKNLPASAKSGSSGVQLDAEAGQAPPEKKSKLVAGDQGRRPGPATGMGKPKTQFAPMRKSGLGGQPATTLGGPASAAKRVSKLGTPGPDSGVRLVPLDSDEEVNIAPPVPDAGALGEDLPRSPAESNVRLKQAAADELLPSEEVVNLDEELLLEEEHSQHKPQAKVKPTTRGPQFPSTSPFELSVSDLEVAEEAKVDVDESSDFDLTGAVESASMVGAKEGEDFSLELPDESGVGLAPSGEVTLESSEASSGDFDLQPAGLSSEESDFEFNLDVGTAPAASADESDSEFELSLEADDAGQAGAASDSDSEFELTLDDSGGLAPLDEDESPQVKAGQEKDIFETDFEVPALEDESGSEVAALDTDLESSDFDLAFSSDVAVEDESGSQVVVLGEEEGTAEGGLEAELEGITEDADVAVEEDLEETGPAREVIVEKLIKPAPWGALPVAFMLPCVIIMLLVGIMGFELVTSVTGYKPAGFLTKTIGKMIGQEIR